MCSCSPHEPDCTPHSPQSNSQPVWPGVSQILAAVLDGLEADRAHPRAAQWAGTGKLFLTAKHLELSQPAAFLGCVPAVFNINLLSEKKKQFSFPI